MTPSAGVGLKPEHYAAALQAPSGGVWFEVHAENYMVDGGPRLAWLEAIRARHPLSLHGVGLSLASDAAPDSAHLRRLRDLVRRFDPVLVSEHLAWSHWRGIYYPDLLPFPRTATSLARIADNVARAQDVLGRCIVIENPAHYLRIDGHAIGEIDFLHELCARERCALLLDVNNVFVGSRNLGYSAERYLDAFPDEAIAEIHIAGHSTDPAPGSSLLIDSHDAPVAREVWSLCERVIARVGPRPILIERDSNLPTFDELLTERETAQRLLDQSLVRTA